MISYKNVIFATALFVAFTFVNYRHAMVFWEPANSSNNISGVWESGNVSTVGALLLARLSRLESWCSTARKVAYVDYANSQDNLISYDWMYVPEYKLFYCSVPKAASTTIKKSLMEVIGVRPSNDTSEIHQQAVKHLSFNPWNERASMSNMPLAKSRRNPFAKTNNGSHSLIVVRNPFERLVSAYQDKIVNRGGDWSYLKRYCSGYAPAADAYEGDKSSNNNIVFKITFSEFVNCVLSNHNSKAPFYDDHICPMSKVCAICLIRYDLIVKRESFSEEIGYALSQLEGDTGELREKLIGERHRLNPTLSKDSFRLSYELLYRQLNERQLSQLRVMYRDDLEIFDYDASII